MDERWVEKIEDRIGDLEKRVTNTEKEQARVSIYIEQIFKKLDDIDGNVSNGITKADLMSLFESMNKSNTQSTSAWQKWTLAIITGTIFAIVAYVFGGK